MPLIEASGTRPTLSGVTPSTTTISSLPTGRARRTPRLDRRRRQLAWSPTRVAREAGEILSLAPCGAGWQLVTDSGRVMYSADGPDARRACLRRAYESGVLCLR